MSKKLHLVYGGELVDPAGHDFRDLNAVHFVGLFDDYQSAYDAWKSEAQRTVDNANMRYFIADLSQNTDAAPSEPSSDTNA